jgi:ATP-binding cassette subfamily B protein
MRGHILYNGAPEGEIEIDDLRKRLGFVTQDTQLFSGTIRENLQFVRPDATDEECLGVLRQASEGLLLRPDHGLDSKIGEGGVKVSGGEKQRISIARALLHRPQLLLFDEATSSLDSLTEEEVFELIFPLSNHTVARRRSAELLRDNLPTARWAERSFDRCGVSLNTSQECATSAIVKVNFLRRHFNLPF